MGFPSPFNVPPTLTAQQRRTVKRRTERVAFAEEVAHLRARQAERQVAPVKSVCETAVLELIYSPGFAYWYEEVTCKSASDFINWVVNTEERYLYGRNRSVWALAKIKSLLDDYRWQTPHYRRYWMKNISSCTDAKKRRAIMIRLATPKWANMIEVAKVHKRRFEITQQTGVAHHVDHIVPIQGRNVCGLNNEFNLRVIPAVENLMKSNKFEHSDSYV